MGQHVLPRLYGCRRLTLQTDDRQTDGRQHIANMNMSSRSLKTRTNYAISGGLQVTMHCTLQIFFLILQYRNKPRIFAHCSVETDWKFTELRRTIGDISRRTVGYRLPPQFHSQWQQSCRRRLCSARISVSNLVSCWRQ